MNFRRICDDVGSMSAVELAFNMFYTGAGGEARYRDFERDLPLRDLMKEICKKHRGPEDLDGLSEAQFDEVFYDSLQFGTEELDGVFALLYQAGWAAAQIREWLRYYEENALPVASRKEVLKECIERYGKQPQVDMAIEEMSELTKALLKERRALHRDDPEAWKKATEDISEEMADVIIMLTQLTMIFENRDRVQSLIARKLARQEDRLAKADMTAAAGAAQEVLKSAT